MAAWVVLPVCLGAYATHRPRDETRATPPGRPYRDVTIRTADGLTIAGRYTPSRNGAAVVTMPSMEGVQDHARMLVRHGYGVLMLDMRGCAASQGEPNAFGWGAAADVRAAVAWLRRRRGRASVGDPRGGPHRGYPGPARRVPGAGGRLPRRAAQARLSRSARSARIRMPRSIPAALSRSPAPTRRSTSGRAHHGS